MNEKDQAALDAVRDAMRSLDWRIESVLTFTHGMCVQVYVKAATGTRSGSAWVKAGPILVPTGEQTLAELVAMVVGMRDDDEAPAVSDVGNELPSTTTAPTFQPNYGAEG